MPELYVRMERAEKEVLIGTINGTDASDARFQYAPDYLAQADSTPVSISLPLQTDPFSSEETRCFFDGLLPEGFTRKSVASGLHVDEADYLSILAALGSECIGALRITPEQEVPSETSYERLSKADIRRLAAEGASSAATFLTKTHLSLAGASGKVGLYYDETHDRWYFPKGTAPSTHIVKQSHVRLKHIVANELLCMYTAAHLQIATPHAFVIDMRRDDKEHLLFATKRFDRRTADEAPSVSGMPRPYRLHQEDFAQALGICAEKKYEPDGADYLRRMFDLLRTHSADPVTDQLRLWEMIVFQCLIGNTDAHLKNYSLLYDETMKTIRLAPSYDIVSTVLYEESTRRLAFRIGDAISIDDVNREALMNAAKEARIGKQAAEAVITRLTAQFETALKQAASDCKKAGCPEAAPLARQILKWNDFLRHP